jgi:hypothetical protein
LSRKHRADITEARFAAQLLGDEYGADAVAVVDRLLAVQAQDLRSARLAVRARTRGLTVADVDRCLTDDRSLVIGWLNRGTLHLVSRDDYWWLHALTTPPLFAANARRLAQTGVTESAAKRGVAQIERALAREGPLTRDELGERVRAVGVATAGQALVHVLMLACLRGIAVRGPFVDGRHAYVSAAGWLGPPRPVERLGALADLARRYLAGHAPANDRDLAKWAGLPLRDARAGLTAIAAELERRDDGLLALKGSSAEGRAGARLLDQWDPVLVGWRSRAAMLADYPRLGSPEAHFRPFAFVHGRAVATWSVRQGKVEIEPPFARVTRVSERALAREAADVERFLAS